MTTNKTNLCSVDITGMIVLVVDDNPANLEMIVGYLQEHGLKTAVASDGDIALRRAGHLRPDLILLDVLMPGMDGFETCLKLKEDEATREIPVIFMTSLTDAEYRTRGFLVGGVDYIAKPIGYAEMYARVKTHLEIRQYRYRLEEKVLKRTEELVRRGQELESANRQLKQLHHTFMTVLDSIEAAVYVSDMETYEILFMNRYLKDLVGADFTGKVCWRAFYDAQGPCDCCIALESRNGRGTDDKVFYREQKGFKTNQWFMNSARAIEWIDGRRVHIHVAMDITKVKELEKERLKTETMLAQAQKMEAIGTLAGGIAHDFNNILSPIIGYVEMVMLDVQEDVQLRNRLQKVLNASNRAKDLVMQILNFSRQSDHEPMPCRIQPTLKEVIRLMKSTLPSTIEIQQDIDENCSPVVADPAKMHQIAMNLITNAYHAMEENGGILSVVFEERELDTIDGAFLPPIHEGPYVCLQISDTGVGMEKSTLDRIFDPYFTTKEKGKGTGLGLAMVRGIVNKYGGAVSVESAPDKGSRFSVFLPPTHRATPDEAPFDAVVKGGREFLLLVDDEPDIAALQKTMLESLGYRVETGTDSLSVLEIFRRNPRKYDLLITDMTMPRMTGEKLTREIIRIREDMPVIICTGFNEHIAPETIKGFGARELVMKPFAKKDLAEAVRRVLDGL